MLVYVNIDFYPAPIKIQTETKNDFCSILIKIFLNKYYRNIQ